MKLLIDILMRPEKYYWTNTPGQFDVAEYLFNNCWDDLTGKAAKKVEFVLLRSGKYQKTSS